MLLLSCGVCHVLVGARTSSALSLAVTWGGNTCGSLLLSSPVSRLALRSISMVSPEAVAAYGIDLSSNAIDVENRCKFLEPALVKLTPCLSGKNHKGQHGRVGLFGGSPVYTGAPFFASMSALRFGADLSYVFTAEEAAPAIKAYSPELMVMPVYNVEKISDDNSQVVQKITDHFHRLHSLVIGPGLGRDVCVLSAASSVVKAAKKESLPLVLDADALEIIVRHDGDIGAMPFYGYGRVVLTPNAPEFVRLMNACGFENDFFVNEVANMDNPVELREGKGRAVERLAAALGNVVVILKGEVDVISDGRRTIACAVPGGMKRCGGLGDVLAGSLGTMLAWNRLHGVEGDEVSGR